MASSVNAATMSERRRRIQSVTDVALTSMDVEDLLVELLERLRELLAVDTAAVLLLDESSQQLVATAASGLEEEVRQGVRVPLGRGFAGRVAATRQPVILNRVDRTTVVNPVLVDKGLRSLLGVPLLVGKMVLGVLHVGSLTDRKFDEDDVSLVQLVAGRVALVTHARLSDIERATAGALQRSLVPTRLPTVPGLDLAARYVPSEAGGVGGDWYDVFTLPSGWLSLVIGDVVGHGLRAAVVMGRLRSALRAYALDGGDPATVLAKLDRKVLHFEPGGMATVLYAVLSPSLGELRVSSAGHPLPILATRDGPASLLDLPIDPPLGVRSGVRRRSSTVSVPAGSVLCLYTDGLVERRRQPIDVGLALLRQAVEPGPAEAVCATVMDRLIGTAAAEDDVALLVVGRHDHAQLDPLELVMPAVPQALKEIRRAASQWLSMAGATETETTEILLTVGEAAANAVEHAYGPRGGDVTVRLEYRPPEVLLSVRDNGRWREPRGKNRGFGTQLMRRCTDELHVDSGPTGTVVRARRRLASQE
jgi:anti-sigma regulatory factor (Ser/Thr protein kinase)/putative methionine-R-sulfoxide reductase with GAF domain